MVEKIIVNPQSIRSYGNITNNRGVEDFETYYSTLTETTDTVHGATSKIFELEDPTIWYDPLTENVHNPNSVVSQGTVTYDSTGATLDATTYSSSNYNMNFRPYNQVITVPYDIEFTIVSQTSNSFRCYFYNTNFSGSAICSGTLPLQNNRETKGKFEGRITRYLNNGTGTDLTLSRGIESSVGFRFGYSQSTQAQMKIKNLRITAVPPYSFTDDCTTDQTSQYNTAVRVGGTTSVATLAFDSTNNVYGITNTTLHDSWYGWVIPDARGLDNVRVTCKVKLNNTSAYNQFLIGCMDNIAQSSSDGTYDLYRIRGDNKADYLHNSASEVSGSSKTTTVSGNYVYVVIEKSGTTIKGTTYDSSMTQLSTYTYSSANSYTNPYYVFMVNAKNSADTKLLGLVKVEPYTPEHSYALAFSQDTYPYSPISVTLTNNGSPVSGETITFTWTESGLPGSTTATTNSNGVASATIFNLDTVTVTATYGDATATCTVMGDIL